MQSVELKKKIMDTENILHGEGKIVVRSSGTESLIRVMVEAKSIKLVESILEDLCNFILSID